MAREMMNGVGRGKRKEEERRHVQLPSRVIAAINHKINAEGCYDAQQLVRTLYHRYLTKGDVAMATELCRYYALQFASLKQEELAVDLCTSLLSCLEGENIYPDEERVLQMLRLFNALADIRGRSRGKYKFINKALRWSCTSEQPFGDVRLHRAAAEAYARDKSYGLCQGHLIFCGDAAALVRMLKEWEREGYMRERPLFWLRTVLILLCLKDIVTAEKLLQLSGQDWNSPSVPAPLQLAYLLVQACIARDRQLFLLLQQKYHLILRRDDLFFKCLAEIERRIIGQQQQQQQHFAAHAGVASLFSSLFANLHTPQQQQQEEEEDN